MIIWLVSMEHISKSNPVHQDTKILIAATCQSAPLEEFTTRVYRINIGLYGGFLKWWYPTTMGFPTKNDHFGVFWGYHHLRKPPYRTITIVTRHGLSPHHSPVKLDTVGLAGTSVDIRFGILQHGDLGVVRPGAIKHYNRHQRSANIWILLVNLT